LDFYGALWAKVPKLIPDCMKQKHEPCDAQIKVWIPQSLFEKVEIAAACEGRSLANMTRRILQHWAAECDRPEAIDERPARH
jgi:hypothetical protein